MKPTETVNQHRTEPNTFDNLFTSSNDQEKRILTALGLASGPLPQVKTEWLIRYHDHLAARLSLPFEAEYAEDISGHRQLVSSVTVIALIPPDPHSTADHDLLCRVRRGDKEINVPLVDVEIQETTPNSLLIEDYWYWIWNWRFDPQI
jgi:hypothetical protein